MRTCLLLARMLFGVGLTAACSASENDAYDRFNEWPVYRGDKSATQYAELAQINAANAHRLEAVWEYRTGDASSGSSMQNNPLIVGGVMYLSTQTVSAVALDAKTGEEIWRFDPHRFDGKETPSRGRSRGVVYWKGPDGDRIFHFVKHRVFALNAKTGAVVESFGQGGYINLRENLGIDASEASIEVTSPGVLYRDFLIVASRVPEGFKSTPGHIRAYDAVTGAFRWIFHTIPKEGEFGYDTWEWVEGETYGGANAWGGLTVDEERGWVFGATGSPTYDFYGAYRKGMNLFGNCVLALDATTGERQWHYQTVRHDIWDYDNPSAPILVTLGGGGRNQDAVVQLTKMGLTFVLDRNTGKPLFPVVDLPVPPSDIPGEEAWPTQPFPLKPPPLARLSLTEADLTNVSPEARAEAVARFRNYRSGPIYTPPSLQGTLTTPGLLGGVEWHGGSFDPVLNVLYVNANDAPSISKLRKTYDIDQESNVTELQMGRQLYVQNCSACHGIERKGVPPAFPALTNMQRSKDEIVQILLEGRNAMPAFSQFSSGEIEAVTEYLMSGIDAPDPKRENEGRLRYLAEGYHIFRDADGAPAISPPWGTLNAIDLVSGEILWKVPLGEYPELVEKGIGNTGSMSFGGAVATAGGVVFIAGTPDEKIRAFEKHSGKVLWEYKLPAGGYATPSVYAIDGRQYVVIVAGGGGKNGTKSGDSVIAFALPESTDAVAQASVSADDEGWIQLFDGKSLEGWVHMNGSHTFAVEDGAIVGRTVPGSRNSFLCSLREFSDFELEVEIMVDPVTNSGIQFRSKARPFTVGEHHDQRAGRVYGPQVEIRRNLGPGFSPTTGVIYGEALGTGWMSSKELMENGHHHYIDDAWNHLRLVAHGPRIATWINGHKVEDLVNEAVHETHPSGFIGLQVHGIRNEGPFEMRFRNIRIRPLGSERGANKSESR